MKSVKHALIGTKLQYCQENQKQSEAKLDNYHSFLSDTQQSNTSERERNKNLKNHFTQICIESVGE